MNLAGAIQYIFNAAEEVTNEALPPGLPPVLLNVAGVETPVLLSYTVQLSALVLKSLTTCPKLRNVEKIKR